MAYIHLTAEQLDIVKTGGEVTVKDSNGDSIDVYLDDDASPVEPTGTYTLAWHGKKVDLSK